MKDKNRVFAEGNDDGIMIMLPADRGAVRIEVEMNGTIYYAVI